MASDKGPTEPRPACAATALTEFLDRARHNRWTTFHNKPAVERSVADAIPADKLSGRKTNDRHFWYRRTAAT
jgi:hypothetical protein